MWWDDGREATHRSVRLLKSHLTLGQAIRFDDNGTFEVEGSDGLQYTIKARNGPHYALHGCCVIVTDRDRTNYMPLGDRILALVLALQTDATRLRSLNRRHLTFNGTPYA